MTRRIVWSLVALLTLTTLGSLWFLKNFEQVPTTNWERPQKEALRNPYLALERLFARLSRPIERVKSPARLDALPANGVLILDNGRRRNIDPARARRLLDWVNAGGYLIVAAENSDNDPLLKSIGITPCRASPKQCLLADDNGDKNDDDDESDDGASAHPASKPKNTPSLTEVVLPDSRIRYRYRDHYPIDSLLSSSPAPDWTAGRDKTYKHLLHFSRGHGQITVVDDLQFLSNWQLNNLDHAELIAALIAKYQPRGALYLASRMEFPTLWQWLAESAWMTLISGALLIGLWLWRIVPRFGGWLAPADTERRDLLQHLAAIGRSVWREGGLAHWLAVVRQPLRQRLALRHPYLNQMETSRQHTVLAEITACTTADIRSALTPGEAQTPKEFTRAMQTLQNLEHRL